MALNLWKLGGTPTSYSPLSPNFVTGQGLLLPVGEYVWRFKAKSNSNLTLRLSNDTAGVSFDGVTNPKLLSLSSTTQYFEVTVKITTSQRIWFVAWKDGALATTSDIIIESIELVQKPLPKLTINGLHGFLSGKWSASGQVVKDSTVFINDGSVSFLPNAQYGQIYLTHSDLYIPCLPNTTHTFSASEVSGNGAMLGMNFYDGNKGSVGSANGGNNVLVHTFTTPSNCYFLSPVFACRATSGFTVCTFKNAMLNVGSIPAPYEPKRGERMVMPTPKKNLLPSDVTQWEVGTFGDDRGNVGSTTRLRSVSNIPLKIGRPYILSCGQGYELLANKGTANLIVWGNPITFTADGSMGRVVVRRTDQAVMSPSEVTQIKPQLEEGTSATPYEPYAVQMNPKPKKFVPKKNLFDGQLELGYISTTTGLNGASGSCVRSIYYIPIKPSTSYMFSNDKNYLQIVYYYDINKNFISYSNGTNGVRSLTTPANAYFLRVQSSNANSENDLTVKYQLEEGSTQTPFEPYQQVLPRSRTGLAFNGTSDYLQLPSMTMDAIEIDCLIDSVQPNFATGSNLFDARTGLIDGWVAGSSNSKGGAFSSVTGWKTGERSKILIKSNSPFTDDAIVFSDYFGAKGKCTKGIIYKVTCYLNGSIVAQYDFENPNNIVGDKVLCLSNEYSIGKNLIPSTGWKQGTQGGSYPDEIWYPFLVPVKPNTTYQLKVASGYNVGCDEIAPTITDPYTLTTVKWNTYTSSRSLTTQAGTGYLRLFVRRKDNGNLSPNDMDQIQIQLEEGSVATAYEPYNITLKTSDSRKNLVPYFEDSRWSIHANAKVLGKDTLHLDATATFQASKVNINVVNGAKYLMTCGFGADPNHRLKLFKTIGGNLISNPPSNLPATWTSTEDIVSLTVENQNTSGSFDFTRPEMHELNGKEGTIVGKPTKLLKAPKRNLYNKR